jgi:hypothetical protein
LHASLSSRRLSDFQSAKLSDLRPRSGFWTPVRARSRCVRATPGPSRSNHAVSRHFAPESGIRPPVRVRSRCIRTTRDPSAPNPAVPRHFAPEWKYSSPVGVRSSCNRATRDTVARDRSPSGRSRCSSRAFRAISALHGAEQRISRPGGIKSISVRRFTSHNRATREPVAHILCRSGFFGGGWHQIALARVLSAPCTEFSALVISHLPLGAMIRALARQKIVQGPQSIGRR